MSFNIIIKKLVITFLAICIAVLPAVAEQRDTLRQSLDKVEKIHGKFTFCVIGDNRTGDDVYRALVSRAMKYSPDFVVNTGDMVNSPDLRNWNKFWDRSKPITAPYFLTPGNHDVTDGNGERFYRDQVPSPGNNLYYSFTAGNALFIILDSNVPGEDKEIAGEQFSWLKMLLSRSRQRHIFVFLHHPLFPEKGIGHHCGQCLDKHSKERDRLEALFAKHKVTAVFAGHEHLYLRKTVDGVTHIITGGGGAPLYTDEKKGGFYHFVLITVEGDKVNGEVIDVGGKVRDKFRL